MKKLIPLLLAIFMLLGIHNSFGATSTSATQLSSMGIMSPQSYETISGGSCKIINNGDGTISISGSTSTYNKVDQVGVKLNLQYYTGGKWTTLKSYSYNRTDSNYSSGGKVISVSGGYNYRVFAQHTSLDGGVSESGQSYSEAIYIP